MRTHIVSFLRKSTPKSAKRWIAVVANRLAQDEVVGDLWAHQRELSWVEHSLTNLRDLGFIPNTVIDVGAFEGAFYQLSRKIFPAANIAAFEAQGGKIGRLEDMMSGDPRANVTQALLGPADGREVVFHELGALSSVLEDKRTERSGIPVSKKTVRLDSALKDAALDGPVLLKLDVQGFELEVLKGAPEILSAAEVVLMECSLVELNEGCPLFHDVTASMAREGFLLYDLCTFFKHGPHRRLRQIDAIFVRADSPLQAKK